MQVAETFTFPIPADQLPADVRSQLAKLLPADAAARRAACPTGNCPIIAAAAESGKVSKAVLGDGVDVAVEISSSSGEAGVKAAKKGKGNKKERAKKGGSGVDEETIQDLEVRSEVSNQTVHRFVLYSCCWWQWRCCCAASVVAAAAAAAVSSSATWAWLSAHVRDVLGNLPPHHTRDTNQPSP